MLYHSSCSVRYPNTLSYLCLLCTVILCVLIQGVCPWYNGDYLDMSARDMKKGYYTKPSELSQSLQDQQQLLNYIRNAKRTASSQVDWAEALCGRWDDWCVRGKSRPGLSCCRGYSCKCNLWNTNCRCKTKMFGG